TVKYGPNKKPKSANASASTRSEHRERSEMKAGIHPEYKITTISCGCGNSWQTRSTKQNLHVDVCSACHPFYTGEQRLVDTAGQVERFQRRLHNAEKQ